MTCKKGYHHKRTHGARGLSSGDTGKHIDHPDNKNKKGKWVPTAFKPGESTEIQKAGGYATKGIIRGLTMAQTIEVKGRMAKYSKELGVDINPLTAMEKMLEEEDLPMGFRLDILKHLSKFTHSAAPTKTENKTEVKRAEDYLDELAALESVESETLAPVKH